ncbi:MAG TPA: EamA family transporter [Flavobacteriaceae bacterium]|jgi:drug/metabolite transporter (DMT)-like permease|nr:EamA family transporter [Flavobacteriaceae bacterium]
MNAMVKYLTDYPTLEIVFFRAIGSLVISFSYLKWMGIPQWGNQKKLMIFRSLVGVTSMILFFWGIHYITVGSAVTLRYVSPIFAGVLAVFYLKETIKPLQWLFFIMAFLGVYLIKNFDASNSNFGVFLVLLAAFFSAIVYILISKIGKGDHPVVVVHYFMLIATVVGGIGCFFFWKTPSLNDLFLLLSLGVFGFFGQLFMTKAFQNAEAHMVAPFKYVEVIFTLFFGVFVLYETYDFYHLIGTFLVVFSLILNVLYKSRLNNKIKKAT